MAGNFQSNHRRGELLFGSITLEEGNNGVIVSAQRAGQTYTDDCIWVVENPYKGVNLFIQIFDFMMIAYKVVIAGFITAFLVWFLGIRRVSKGPRWQRVILWTIFVLLSLGSLIILLIKYFISNMMGA